MRSSTRNLALPAALLTALMLLLAACASKEPPKPPMLSGTIKVAATANPSASKRPSPLLLRIYELKSAAAFNNADFMRLYQQDQAELAADLVAREEYLLSPGEAKTFVRKLAPETRFVGVFAAYRDVEHAVWRQIAAVPPGEKPQALIQAQELTVELSLR